MSDTQQFSAKAFINGLLVETPAATYEVAKDIYWSYRETPGCDAAYIYEGDRIRESWSQSYDDYMASTEGVIDEDDEDDQDDLDDEVQP